MIQLYIYTFFFLNYSSIYLFLEVLGLRCRAQTFSSCGEQASHCSGFSCCRAGALGHAGFPSCGAWAAVLVACGLRCPVTCRILSDQGSNLCPLHWQIPNHWTTREGPILFHSLFHNLKRLFFFIVFSSMVYYRKLNIVPCAIQ